ncbi:hypothetical protein JHK85_013562 [Glycine max]|nr:hypothetical protein JHK85_013562 [Glycine max]
MEFSDHLTYLPGKAPRSVNQATLKTGGMKILSKEDMETIEHCIAMSKRGYTVEADDLIKDMAITAEYIGDVDYLDNQECDDSDSIMSLLRAESSQSVVSCADKRGNIAHRSLYEWHKQSYTGR